jgi:hypothetical protein
MADYIRREDALFALRKAERGGSMTALTRLERAYAEIREMPAADVAEVVHGQWYLLDDCANAGVYCSACGRRVHREEFAYKKLRSKYCPHCGAKMDGGVERGK